MSTLAMLAKASFLWQRADYLARAWNTGNSYHRNQRIYSYSFPGMPHEQAASYRREFTRLEALIDGFRDALVPPNRIIRPTPAMTRTLVVAHSVAHSAALRLQSVFSFTEVLAKRKRLTAARSVLGIIAAVPLRHFKYINPIMGVCVRDCLSRCRSHTWTPQTVWAAACGVFLEEINALQALRTSSPREEEINLRAFLSRAGVGISAFESSCPLLRADSCTCCFSFF